MGVRGISQASLAESTGFTKKAVSDWCNPDVDAMPRPSSIGRIARGLRIRKEEVFMHPFQVIPARDHSKVFFMQSQELRKLEDWVGNPQATMDGKPIDARLRKNILEYAKQLVRVARR